MCNHCDYEGLIKRSGLEVTPNRIGVLEIIGNNNSPLSAREVFNTFKRQREINRVTVYRILDLLVEKGLLDRLSGGGRAFYYGLAPNENHDPHPHFYCKQCGNMECLNPETMLLDVEMISRTFPGQIENVEVRVDGVCKVCIRQKRKLD